MACDPAGCQSTCYQNEQFSEENSTPAPTQTQTSVHNNGDQQQGMCLKCKVNPPISGSGGGSSGDDARFCGDCFRNNLFGKFRLAVTSHAMITPSDNVLVAFSGGVGSRVALQFVHDMQQRGLKNYEASKDRSLSVFGVGVAFVNESAVRSIPTDKVEEAMQEMKLTVSKLAPPVKQFHVVLPESIYSSSLSDDKDKLMKLLGAVDDITGKEDLLLYLRMLALQKIASENGYTKLVLGSCTSRIACHVLAATVKGQGYSLSADIQHVDARYEIPVVLPLRDCTAQELNILCRIDGFVLKTFPLSACLLLSINDSLKALQLVNDSPSGINGLISSFVRVLQEENPARECTIVRTAAKLTPFHFNRIPEINDSNVPLATRRRQKRYNLKPHESISSESFCPICNSPVNNPSQNSLKGSEITEFSASCCSSCQFQILPQDQLSMKQFYSVLPERIVARAKPQCNGNQDMLSEILGWSSVTDISGSKSRTVCYLTMKARLETRVWKMKRNATNISGRSNTNTAGGDPRIQSIPSTAMLLQLHLHHLHLLPQQPLLSCSPNSFTCSLPIANVNPTHRPPKPLIGARTVRCMASPRRVKMVAKQIQREISDMLLTDKVLQYAILPEAALGADRYLSSITTISDVEVSGDLQVVKVYVSVFGDDRGKEVALAGLKSKAKYVRGQLGKRMRLRLTPEVRFLEDEAIEKGSRVIAILDKIKSEKGTAQNKENDPESEDDGDWEDDDPEEGIIYVD
ncbi:Cytoplasmic tRNA 2-thiolation protein 2 [Linum grandiflorum]